MRERTKSSRWIPNCGPIHHGFPGSGWRREDDKYWRSGLFYVNREDHALMVPRRFGLGWTLNFGNPRAAMILAGVVALIGLVITIRFSG
ncbi:DUF5808 domain-containing protein [Arthrobacter sp. M-10]|jgi:uncharacterized membrane protein|uniref:DUF5808 domain-containing protein n=1 Tax=unclassified Arthrobacter TaxID=235627 RepID=UPI003F8E0081